MKILDPTFGWCLLEFLLSYGVILATPGPNLFVIGSVAAMHGVRGVVPLCLGVSLGAGTLSTILLATVGFAPAASWYIVARISSAFLLLWVALKVARQRSPGSEPEPDRGAALAELGAGFCTAATNPLTAAFFAAQFLGPLSAGGNLRFLVPISVMAAALLFFLSMGTLLGRPFLRRITLTWHRPICLAASAVLVVMALSTLKNLFGVMDWFWGQEAEF